MKKKKKVSNPKLNSYTVESGYGALESLSVPLDSLCCPNSLHQFTAIYACWIFLLVALLIICSGSVCLHENLNVENAI